MELFIAWCLVAGVQLAATMSPGPAFVVAMHYGVSYSRRAAIFLALGLGMGVAAHVLFVLVGISLLISQSVLLYSAIKYAGAAYLFYIGIKNLRSARKAPQVKVEDRATSEVGEIGALKAFVTGFMTNLLNPKAVIFFTAVFTQFISADTPSSVLALYGGTSVMIEFVWFACLGIVLTNERIKGYFTRVMRWIEGVCGGLLVALGVKLALSRA